MVGTVVNRRRAFWLPSNVLLKLYVCIILPRLLLLSAVELKCGSASLCVCVCVRPGVFWGGEDTTGTK